MYNSNTSYSMVATSDIGRAAAEAFERPAEFKGKTIELVGDSLTLDEIKKVWNSVTGTELGGGEMPDIPKPFADTIEVSWLMVWSDSD